MDTSDLAKRMKDYEMRDRYFLQKRIPVAVRVDMRAGHTFTKGFERPFDKVFMKSMQETAKYMCENMGNAKFAYVQSDEITIILVDYDTLETDCLFNYRTDKLCSISASMATMAFNKFFYKNVEEYSESVAVLQDFDIEKKYLEKLEKAIEKGAMFDARVFNIPKEEVTNLIYWRQLDATRNSIQMVGQANFSHKQLQHKSCNEVKEMLLKEKGINWDELPTHLQRGSCYIRKPGPIQIITKEQEFGDPIELCRQIWKWEIDTEIPIFKGDGREYIEKLIYIGEE